MNTQTEVKANQLSQSDNLKLAYELKNEVSNWVQTFNFIQVDVLQLVAQDCLFEYIRQPEITFEDVAEYSDLTAKQLKRKYSEVENCPEYDSCREEKEQNNYPMWNTCFEFKENESEEVIKAAIDAGCGVIEGLGDFNQILFFSGCGYSFYGSHWIPLFLSLPWNEDKRKKYNGVNYSMM